MKNISLEQKTSSNIKFDKLESLVSNYMENFINKRLSGVQISITKNNIIVFSRGYGLANREKKILVNKNSTFNYASVSKLFIWVSVMQLVEQEKLDLNKNILEYLPKNYPLQLCCKEPITLLHLMNHTAGFEASWKHYDNKGNMLDSSDFNSLEEAISRGYSNIQCFKPGEVQGYSNFGATLAALIVEKVTDKPFYEYVMENIFKPCKMNCCFPEQNPITDVINNKVIGYRFKKGEFKITQVYSANWLYASGSVIGTADDLAKFALALMPLNDEQSPLFKNKKILQKLLSLSYTPTGEELFSVHHGFFGTEGNYRGIGHTGCVEGMSSHFLILPEENFSVSVLANDQDADDICLGIMNILTMTDYPRKNKKVIFPDAKIFAGKYVKARTQFVNRKTPFEIAEISSIDENNIKLELGKKIETYQQIEPYLFENTQAPEKIPCNKKIYFQVINNEVIKYVGFASDWLPLNKLKKFNAPK